MILLLVLLMFLALFTATEEQATLPPTPTPTPVVGEEARVLRVIDGDTIEVSLNRRNRRVRYIGINTPERDEPCSNAATAANRRLVGGRDVTLVRGAEETDRYGRLLRYIHADGIFVNEALVREGFAENFVWEPNTRFADRFRALEAEARAAGRGCHPSGVFDDGDTER
ncbi:MAG: thermonuclease family protein [Anaerolineaceae bacterium]|nr:thermonuclease family protein [Anaerolineaceae bacterium]MCY3907766.1 thermonuclease family protein [Anaerolineaceae bacterium]